MTQQQTKPDGAYGLDYSYLPQDLQHGFREYFEKHAKPGGFITATLRNDLVNAVARADENSREHLLAIVRFLYNEAPSGAWGSEDVVKQWLKGGE